MAKRLLSYDPLTKTTSWHDYDHSTKTTFITESQDVSAILKNNESLRNDGEYKRHGIKEDLYHYARVPNSVIVEWKQKYGVDGFSTKEDDLKKIDKLLSSPDYKYLRTVNRI